MIETTIQVTSDQLAPITIENFCATDIDDTSDIYDKTAIEALLLPAAFAATISLRCSTDVAQTVSYASVPLDIRLVCNSTENQRSDAMTD